jgi:hypothetical protein
VLLHRLLDAISDLVAVSVLLHFLILLLAEDLVLHRLFFLQFIILNFR